MRMERFEKPADWSGIVLVRLVRRWVALRETGMPALPAMVERAGEFGIPAEAAVALASVLELTEACLGRPLRAMCCSSHEIGADERALLLLLALAPESGAPLSSPEIPHGLPSALGWAVASLRRLLGAASFRLVAVPGGCPFAGPPPGSEPGCAAAGRPKTASLQFQDAASHDEPMIEPSGTGPEARARYKERT